MPRRYRIELPIDTSFFTPTQLQSRVLLASIMNGWAGWIRQHVISFPRMLAEHRCGAVVMSSGFEHEAPLRFFEADALTMETTMRFVGNGRFAEVELICSAGERRVVRVRSVGRIVILGGDDAMSATPGELPDALKQRLEGDELSADKPARPLKARLDRVLAEGTLLAESSREFVIHRHQCEVADQWSFIEMAGFAAESREQLVAERGDTEPFLRRGLREPLQRFETEYHRPMFLLDRARIATRAFRFEDRLAMVHQVDGDDGQARAVALEEI